MCAQSLSHVQLLATLWTKLLCTMKFSRQEYQSGLPFSTPRDLPDPGIEPKSPASSSLTGRFFTTAPPGKPIWNIKGPQTAKTILKKNKAGGLTVNDFVLYYKATVVKTYSIGLKYSTVQYWPVFHLNQWNRIETPEVNLPTYDQMIFDKGSKIIQ